MSLFGSKKVCKFYIPDVPNSCRSGDNCSFLHDDSTETRKSIDGQKPPLSQGYVIFDKRYKHVAKKTDSPPASVSKSSATVTRKVSKETDTFNDSAEEIDPELDQDASGECEDGDYSELADLSPEEIASFDGMRFTRGSIPLSPPPRSLV